MNMPPLIQPLLFLMSFTSASRWTFRLFPESSCLKQCLKQAHQQAKDNIEPIALGSLLLFSCGINSNGEIVGSRSACISKLNSNCRFLPHKAVGIHKPWVRVCVPVSASPGCCCLTRFSASWVVILLSHCSPTMLFY